MYLVWKMNEKLTSFPSVCWEPQNLHYSSSVSECRSLGPVLFEVNPTQKRVLCWTRRDHLHVWEGNQKAAIFMECFAIKNSLKS